MPPNEKPTPEQVQFVKLHLPGTQTQGSAKTMKQPTPLQVQVITWQPAARCWPMAMR